MSIWKRILYRSIRRPFHNMMFGTFICIFLIFAFVGSDLAVLNTAYHKYFSQNYGTYITVRTESTEEVFQEELIKEIEKLPYVIGYERNTQQDYKFYINDVQNIDKAEKKIKRLMGDNNIVTSSIENASIGYSNIALAVEHSSAIMLKGTCFSGIVLLVLMLWLWLREHSRDVSIYIMLGKKYEVIISEILLEIGIIICPAIMISTMIGIIWGSELHLFIINRIIGFQQTNYIYQPLDEIMVQESLALLDILKIDVYIFLISMCVAALLALILFSKKTNILYQTKN